VKSYFSRRAANAAERIDARWRDNADDPRLFATELLAAIECLEDSITTPGSPFPTSRRPGLRRLLLPRSRCHLYFEIDETKQRIQILHMWDGRRARAPKL
jgi:hypothetical protein